MSDRKVITGDIGGDSNQSFFRKKWQDQNLDKKTKEILAKDEKYFIRQSLSTPCLNVLKKAKGIYIEDIQGKKYIDFHGNNVHQVGFGNEEVIDAVVAQLRELPFCTRRYANEKAVELAETLAQLTPENLNKMLFVPGGSEATGLAIKIARLVTGRYKTISVWDAFHGAGLDAVSIGGVSLWRKDIGPLLPGTEHVPSPDTTQRFMNIGSDEEWEILWAKYVEYILEKEGDIAAVISEPIRSTPYIPSKKYWEIIRKACDKHGTLLIFDEIPHCLGRTGTWFTCENFGVVPDILCIGKGLGGGVFPIAATIVREEFDIAAERAIGHYTHEKSPVGAAAALAVIHYIKKHNILNHVVEVGEFALTELKKLKEKHKLIKEVRGIGLFLGIELEKENGEKAVEECDELMYKALEKGLSLKTTMGNIITLTPALVITKDEIKYAVDMLDQCFNEL